MTAQINDTFRYRETNYSVAGISAGELFEPAVVDLRPAMASTACWRGYQVVYAIVEAHLVVADLYVNLLEDGAGYHRKQGPTINGVMPTEKRKGTGFFFNNYYHGLNYHLEYTGGLLLADGFLRDLYVHMGFHPAWKYERVVELIFENGALVKEFDRSVKMAEVRQMIIESRDDRQSNQIPTEDEIRAFVERAFDRTYGM